MPTYQYECSNCLHGFEIYQGMLEDALERCPECSVNTLLRVLHAPMCFVKGEPTTLGHLAERNAQKFGRAECEERELRSKELAAKARGKKTPKKSATPWWRNGSVPGLVKKDTVLSPQECEKYTEELKAAGCKVETNASVPQRIKNDSKTK